MTDEVKKIAEGLSEGLKRAITHGFAGPFSRFSQEGMRREWADICELTGGRRNYRNTIDPVVRRGLAERLEDGTLRLNFWGVSPSHT